MTHTECWNILHKALAKGLVEKPKTCSKCGFIGTHINGKRISGHHPDYDKPLDVIWLCDSCHRKIPGHSGWAAGGFRKYRPTLEDRRKAWETRKRKDPNNESALKAVATRIKNGKQIQQDPKTGRFL